VAALRGAFIRLDAGLLGFAPNIVIFQFNPDTITRSPSLVAPPLAPSGSGPQAPQQQPAEPSEQIAFTLRLDATDQLALGDPIATGSGILPVLSALEILQYPKSSLASSLFGGAPQPYQNPPTELPTVLFFWGQYRILPVTVNSLSVTETQYDQLLNPVRAEVSVSLSVLTRSQLPADARFARGAYEYTQGAKEVMAAVNLASPIDVITKTLGSL